MRVVKFLAKVVFGLIIVLAIGSYLMVRNFDLNKYKHYAEEMAEQYLGRKLSINGEASVAISLIPTIVVNDVTLANADWAKEPLMASVKQAEITFALMPLLKKQIVIDNIVLNEPQIYLEKSASGQANWEFAGALKPQPTVHGSFGWSLIGEAQAVEPTADSTSVLAGFAARSIVIENGMVDYFDAQTKQRQNLALEKLELEIPGFDENMSTVFDLTYNGQKISGKAKLGTPMQLMSVDEAFPIVLTAKALGADVDVNGSVVDALNNPRYAAIVGFENPAGNMGAPKISLKTQADGDLKSANMQIDKLSISGNNISGRFKVRWDGKVPQVSGDLQSPKINLPSLEANKTAALAFPVLIGEAQALESVPDTPVPYNLLYSVDANLKLAVQQLILSPGMQAQNVKLTAVLKNGRLALKPVVLDFGGGTINATLNVDAAVKSVALTAKSQNMKLQNLHQEFSVAGDGDFGVKSGGALDLDINVTSVGATYRQLSQNLKGLAAAVVDKSVVQAGSLQFLSSNFISQLLTALKIKMSKTTDLNLTCAVLRANLGSGKAVFPSGVVIDAKQLTIVGDGEINLVNDAIAFTIAPALNELASGNVAQALASFIKIGGTLEKPRIMLDDKEAFKTLVGVAATGGIGYLGSQMFLNGSGSPCYAALEGTPYASRFPKPTGVRAASQDIYRETTQQIQNGINGVTNAAKDFLGMFKSKK